MELRAGSWKRNKIDKLLTRLIKKKKINKKREREKAQVSKTRNEKEFTADSTEIQRVIRDCYTPIKCAT